MSIKVSTSVQSNVDLDKFIRVLVKEIGKSKNLVGQMAEQLIADIERMILLEIATQHPIGQFMAARTNIKGAFAEGRLEFLVSGKPESEVNDPYTQYRERSGESINKKNWHLWEFHEFGGTIGAVQGQFIEFQKGGIGPFIKVKSRKATRVTKYKGQVREVVNSLAKQIQMYVEAVLTIGLEQYLALAVNKASGGVVRPQTDRRALLKKVGLSEAFLKRNNISLSQDKLGRPIFKQAGVRISTSKVKSIGRKM